MMSIRGLNGFNGEKYIIYGNKSDIIFTIIRGQYCYSIKYLSATLHGLLDLAMQRSRQFESYDMFVICLWLCKLWLRADGADTGADIAMAV